jgi:hypothetical protein
MDKGIPGKAGNEGIIEIQGGHIDRRGLLKVEALLDDVNGQYLAHPGLPPGGVVSEAAEAFISPRHEEAHPRHNAVTDPDYVILAEGVHVRIADHDHVELAYQILVAPGHVDPH